MKLEDLALLMRITKDELIEQLKQNDIIELKLIENNKKEPKETGTIEIL
ncbi:MAG: hypothetical protein QF568_02975 [Flavobacteriales bacterium]|jgi:hypothetical protein|nr:hypothetical protein [Flavobacteriales bacterium]|tara:strand:+ start:4624 stop:4770 length:147 start_codon:yes stop_codon:yes gene_type:complete